MVLLTSFVRRVNEITYRNFSYLDMWDGEIQRRNFFENYASANDFDPLVPDNWYAQPKDKIMSYKVISRNFSEYAGRA